MDWIQYWWNYKDLRDAGLHHPQALEQHWNHHGQHEGRTLQEVIPFQYRQYWLNYWGLRHMKTKKELFQHYFHKGYSQGKVIKPLRFFDWESYYQDFLSDKILTEDEIFDSYMENYSENTRPYIKETPIETRKQKKSICLGIGDLFVLGQALLLHPTIYEKYIFYLDPKYLTEKGDIERSKFLEFIKYLVKKLQIRQIFWISKNQEMETLFIAPLLTQFPIHTNSMDHIFLSEKPAFPSSPYIVINVNSRLLTHTHDAYDFDMIVHILNTTEFSLPVILLGSKVSETPEVQLVGKKYNYSFYDRLDKTRFMDWTRDEFLTNFPQKEIFEKDMNVLIHSHAVIQIGLGGSLCFSSLLSKKLICYLEPQRYILPSPFFTHWLELVGNGCFCKDLEDFSERIKLL